MNINGLEVIPDPTQTRKAQRKVLRACALALSTTRGIDWSNCKPIEVAIVEDTGRSGVARWISGETKCRMEIERYVPVSEWDVEVNAHNARHELWHHHDFAGGLTPEQRHELFVEFTGKEPNAVQVTYGIEVPAWRPYVPDDPRFPWPDGSLLWNGGKDYNTRPCEDYAYICEEIYDGELDGLKVDRPNLKGRKREVAARVQEILGTSVDVYRGT